MQDLVLEIQERSKQLDVALSVLKRRGSEYADAERNYRIAIAQKILLERDKGTPVTIMSDICRGSREIADLRFKRDVAEVMYKSALEAVQVIKINMRVIDNQINREYGRGNTL